MLDEACGKTQRSRYTTFRTPDGHAGLPVPACPYFLETVGLLDKRQLTYTVGKITVIAVYRRAQGGLSPLCKLKHTCTRDLFQD